MSEGISYRYGLGTEYDVANYWNKKKPKKKEKMSKEADAIHKAYRMGWRDRAEGKVYTNTFNKNKERYKHRAYKNGYYERNTKN